jgi:hypothetical protein
MSTTTSSASWRMNPSLHAPAPLSPGPIACCIVYIGRSLPSPLVPTCPAHENFMLRFGSPSSIHRLPLLNGPQIALLESAPPVCVTRAPSSAHTPSLNGYASLVITPTW